MLFLVEMEVNLPPDMDPDRADDLRGRERDVAQRLQREGRWRHLWRVAGRYANVSVFDVGSPDELHDIISGLPLFPYMRVEVTPLAQHPSAIVDERGRDSGTTGAVRGAEKEERHAQSR